VYLSKVFPSFDLFAALKPVVLCNQLPIAYRKLIQAVPQAFHFMFGKVVIRLNGRWNILAIQRDGRYLTEILQPDSSCHPTAK
jgi:hypothetical protein